MAGSRRLGKRRLLVALVLAIALSGFALTAWPSQSLHSLFQMGQPSSKAALIDSLSLSDPDPPFVSNLTRTFSSAGIALDYYGPSQVTVGLFRNLPSQGYRMIIIRSHTATFFGVPTSLAIVTSEPYTKSKYVYEQLVGQIAPAVVRPGNTYFAITPSFVRDAMQGNFWGSVIIQMGCSTLQGHHAIATAFMVKGASAFVGWDDSVGSSYTDLTTKNFVSSLVHGHVIGEAVASAGGPDPTYNGRLSFLDPATVSHDRFDNAIATFGEWAILLCVTLLVAEKLVKKR
jgi:hypothetical protein